MSRYYTLSKDTINSFPIKESLGHKNIGIEPDLIIDFRFIPTIYISSSIFSEVKFKGVKLSSGVYDDSKTPLNEDGVRFFYGFNVMYIENRFNVSKGIDKGIFSIKSLSLNEDKLDTLYDEGIDIFKVDSDPSYILVSDRFISFLKALPIKDIEFRNIG